MASDVPKAPIWPVSSLQGAEVQTGSSGQGGVFIAPSRPAAPTRMKKVEVYSIEGVPEIAAGCDLPKMFLRSISREGLSLRNGDVVVVKQKVVSKAEGRVVALASVNPSNRAVRLAGELEKDPRLVELILKESVRVVRAGHGVIITETRHGFVCANSGVDQSNVGPGLASLLPTDPDRSAKLIRKGLQAGTGKKLAVIITDTFGRPWRRGQTDVAIGCSGISPLLPYRGRSDSYGYELRVTEPALADEIAGAAELVTGKLERIPLAVVRGVKYNAGEEGASSLVMDRKRDLFR